MKSETVTYKIKLVGEALKDYESGHLSIIDLLSDELNIPQKNIELIKNERFI